MKADYHYTIDKSLQKMDQWVEQLNSELRWLDKNRSFRLLRVSLHALRDSLPADEAAQLAAQLPLVMKGYFYEGWNPTPNGSQNRTDFLDTIGECFLDDELTDVEDSITCVFTVMNSKISAGEIEDVRSALHHSLQDLWSSPRKYNPE